MFVAFADIPEIKINHVDIKKEIIADQYHGMVAIQVFGNVCCIVKTT